MTRLYRAARPFRRLLLATLLTGVAALPMAAGADTPVDEEQPTTILSAMQQVLGAEQSALAAFAETSVFRRTAGLPDQEVALDVDAGDVPEGRDEALARIDAMSDEDADAADTLDGARTDFRAGILTTDRSGALPLADIRNVRVPRQSAQWRCLAEALYFESRGESLAGQVAVGEVILNRVDSQTYPDSICSVVKQGSHRRNACQFSFACDGHREVIRERGAFDLAGKIAWVLMEGRPRVLTGGATHFHTTAVKPKWSRRLVRTAKIGNHIFYRRGVKLSSR